MKKKLESKKVVKKSKPSIKKVKTLKKSIRSRLKKEASEVERVDFQEISDTIHEFVEKNPKIMVLWGDETFVILVSVDNLTVNKVISTSVFQPYETNETKQYCLLSIVKIGDPDTAPLFIDNLIKLGCPVYKINHSSSVPGLLDKIC